MSFLPSRSMTSDSGRSPKFQVLMSVRSNARPAAEKVNCAASPSCALSAGRSRPLPSSRPLGSTTQTLTRRCAGTSDPPHTSFGMAVPRRVAQNARNASLISRGASVASLECDDCVAPSGVCASRNAVTTSGSGVSRWRQALGNAFMYQVTFSRTIPGTSHDSRCASTWLRSASGTVSVRPSSGCPGAKRYLSGSRTPAISRNSGYCASVTPEAP